MEYSRIPKEINFSGNRKVGRANLPFKDVCKRDMTAMDIDTMTCEMAVVDPLKWKHTPEPAPASRGIRQRPDK